MNTFQEGGEYKIYYSGVTCYGLANELKSKPDDFLTVTVEDREYIIRGTKKVKNHANVDDSTMHTTLLCDENSGNIIR